MKEIMRKLLLASLLTLLTLPASITSEAVTLGNTSHAGMTERNNQHHKKDKRHRPSHRPKGIVVHHGHTPYIFSNGRYYCKRGGAYTAVRPAIGVRIPALPKGYVIIKKKKGKIRYAYRDVIYERISYNGRLMFKVVGFM